MEEPFLPWWLVLLAGMWAVALAVWQHPGVHREVRLWAGLLTLAYLGLIFLALGIRTHASKSGVSSIPRVDFVTVGFALCIIVTLASSVWMLGRVSLRSRQLCYVLLTIANAGVCALMHAPEIAVGLLVVALLSMRPFFQEWSQRASRPWHDWLADFTRFQKESAARDKTGEFWLIAGLNGILACVLIGTVSYSLRIETTRSAPSSRHTALPSRADLNRIHSSAIVSNHQASSLVVAFGRRADVVVLMAVIVFLCLAIARNDLPRTKTQLVSVNHDSSDQHSEENG